MKLLYRFGAICALLAMPFLLLFFLMASPSEWRRSLRWIREIWLELWNYEGPHNGKFA